MTNTLDTPQCQAAAPAEMGRTRSAGHIVAIVIGCLMLLPGLGLVTGGAAIAIAQAVATDDDGYFSFTLDRVESDGMAIATTDLWLDDVEGDASPWVLDWIDLDLRLRVQGAASTEDVFVGIARTADVESYLAGTAHTKVIELDEHTPRYRSVGGVTSIAPPVDQDFWTASATGSGEQELEWDTRGGRWSVVVMNADGSPAIAADVQVGARSGIVTPVAITLLVFGGIGTGIAVVLFIIGARGRRRPAGPKPTKTPLPPPPPESAVQLDQDRQPTAVS